MYKSDVEKDWEIVMNCELPRGICQADRKLPSEQRRFFRIS